jgi:hypothetical protein
MIKKYNCTECGKEFGVGEWICADGTVNHKVSEKVYRALDVPLDPGKPAAGTLGPVVRGRTVVCNIPPPKKVMENGEVHSVGEGSVEFVNGIYSTTDPEIQYWLDKKPGYQASEEQWKQKWYTSEELIAEKEIELNAKAARLENERNELLTQVQKQKKEQVAARP